MLRKQLPRVINTNPKTNNIQESTKEIVEEAKPITKKNKKNPSIIPTTTQGNYEKNSIYSGLDSTN